jgi:hypothetical protein
MKILRTFKEKDLLINQETDFQTNLGWEENLIQFEDEVLSSIVNPVDNYETIRYIHKPYTSSGITQTDIWFYFYFYSGGTYTQDYEATGITHRENGLMLSQTTKSFFKLEFYKTPLSGNTYQPPTRENRKLVFSRNLLLPLGEKYFYTTLNKYLHMPVFTGSNYRNKENMYQFWFEDESVLDETLLSGTTTGNTFFMTAKFYNAKDGSIIDFTNNTGYTEVNDYRDMYYQFDIDKTDYSYKVYNYSGITNGSQIGKTGNPIKFYEKR